MASILNLGWLGQNSLRPYPLRDTGTREDSSGSFSIPDSLLLDASISVPAGSGVDYTGFYLSGVVATSASVRLALSYAGSVVASFVIPADTHEVGDVYTVSCTEPLVTSVASITVGSLAGALEQPGAWTIEADAAPLEPITIRPSAVGVSALRVLDADGSYVDLSGVIRFIAGTNTQFVVTTTDTGYSLRIDAISDSELGRTCDCGGASTSKTPITSINNVAPDADGNIDIVPTSGCTSITGGSTGQVLIEDTCSSTCCDDSDLANVVTDVNNFRTQVMSLTNLANRLALALEKLSS